MKLLFQIDGRTFVADLICLLLFGLNKILGMDWLLANRVMLNCFDKTILFFSSPPFESVIAISLYLSSLSIDCCGNEDQGYALLSASVSKYEQKLSGIPVVREYPDVFPEDIPEFPQKREIEFLIDLVPGTGPIFIAPYRMLLLELAKLKKQIEELLEKQFIRPSASP